LTYIYFDIKVSSSNDTKVPKYICYIATQKLFYWCRNSQNSRV